MGEPSLELLDGFRWDGAPIPGDRSQALLAALVLAAPRAVPVAVLIDDVWPEERPEHPEKALQVLVSRTRTRTEARAVSRDAAGYRLGLRDDEVDALRLRRLVAAAQAAHGAGDLDVARLAARDALAVSLGRAADDGPVGELLRAASHERRAAALLLGRVLLARGAAGEALPLLEAAHAQDPSDEDRLVDVLRAEAAVRGVPAALARYAAYVEGVRENLGAEPGEGLRRLHAELLARDAPVREGLKYDAAPMIGRDDDVAALRGLLDRSRVVSIVGAGGLGKTRMAHLVGRLAEQPVVHLVELAGVTAPDGVLSEVAASLGVRESMTSVRTVQLRSDLRGRVAEHLGGPPTLLILDNCEHLVAAVADLVAFVVATTERTRVLTTSRAPLGLAAEQVYLLPQLGEQDAVALFGQRARSARPDVRLDPGAVSGLVRRLDGLPLAIELAAAKTRVMSVAEIARRLEDRFALLAGGDRSLPARHQTLEAVIAWSWNLLRREDQEALSELAVFPDGFSLEGAQALLGRDPLASLAELVDQSLLVVREGERIRYRFLETVREYGLARLGEAGADARVRAGLRDWAAGFARAAVARLFTVGQIEVMGEIRAEAGNLASVMRAALAAGDVGTLTPTIGVLAGFWTVQGDHLTLLGLTRPVLDLLVAQPVPGAEHRKEVRGVLAALVINATIFSGRPPEAALHRLCELGLEGDGSRTDALVRVMLEVYAGEGPVLGTLNRLCDDPDPQVALVALQWATQVFENSGELADAVGAVERGLALCTDADGPWTRALLQAQACGLATQAGDWELCVRHAARSLPVMEAVGAVEDAIQLRSLMALADIARGRLDEAAEVLDAISREEHSDTAIGWAVGGLTGQAELALARGEVERGLGLYLDLMEVSRERHLVGVDVPREQLPWVLFAEATVLVVHVLHGRSAAATPIAETVRAKIPALLAADDAGIDYPVLGGILLGFGLWSLVVGERPGAAVRLVALGHRFGYHRSLPTMAWSRISRFVDDAAPGVLDDLVMEYAGRPAADLRVEARDAVEQAVRV